MSEWNKTECMATFVIVVLGFCTYFSAIMAHLFLMPEPMKTLIRISYLIAMLTLVSCLISITHNDIYQDGSWANAQWLGQDAVTLLLALPLLLLSTHHGVRAENWHWQILHAGILLYYFYTYSFFMFAANLTVLYVFHLPIFGLASVGLVLECIHLFNLEVAFSFPARNLVLGIIIYLSLISLMVTLLWSVDIYSHLTDPTHRSGTPTGEAPLIIYSLDLGLIIPLMLMAAVLLYRQAQWGYLLTGIILVKTSTLGFALMAMGVSMYVQELNPEYYLILLWSVIGLLGGWLTVSFLKHLAVSPLAQR